VRVAEIDGVLVGFATALPREGYLELEDLFVDPDFMRRGIATALIDDVKQRGLPVEVSANEHALAFYTSVGFVEIGTVETLGGPAIRMRLVA
jgi:GNAT superfamily N-acetyltransferase